MNRSMQTLMAAALLCLGAGSTLAQQERSDRLIRRPALSPVERVQGTSQIIIRSEQDGDTIEVRIVDGETTATVNGKPVPSDRVVQTPEEIQILGKDGTVEHRVKFSQTQPSTPPRPPLPAQGTWFAEQPPKVMIGITMSNEGGGGVRIDSVIESLPAAKAGLKAGEVIWSIDGTMIDNEAELRELLRDKEPGDKLEVKVKQQDGEFREVTLKLESFDAARMGQIRSRTMVDTVPGARLGTHEQMMENLRRSLEQVDNIKESDIARIEEEVERAFAMRSRSGDVVAIAPRASGGGGAATRAESNALTFSPLSNAQNEEVIKKLESVLKKLERVEKRLEEMEKKLGAGNPRE